jgi:hypothetical protein
MEAAKMPILSLHEKGHDCTRIYQKLPTRLGHTPPVESTITDWLRKLKPGDDITRRAPGSGRLPDDPVDVLITPALEQRLFHSVRTFCSVIKHPRTTMGRHLHFAGFVVHNLCLVPHELSPSQKAERVGMAIKL